MDNTNEQTNVETENMKFETEPKTEVDVLNKKIEEQQQELDEKEDRINYCRIRTTNEDYTHCCYFKSDSNDGGKCMELTDDQYENIKKFKNYLKNSDAGIKIRCSSEYLAYSLFALLALLI